MIEPAIKWAIFIFLFLSAIGLAVTTARGETPTVQPEFVHSIPNCVPCKRLKTHLTTHGAKLREIKVKDTPIPAFPFVIYSDGRFDFGGRIYRGEVQTTGTVVRVLEYQ